MSGRLSQIYRRTAKMNSLRRDDPLPGLDDALLDAAARQAVRFEG